jgi:hypothetical protein
VIAIVRALVARNESVDCIDVWTHQEMLPAAKHELDVALDRLSDREFRFLENHHFTFVAA